MRRLDAMAVKTQKKLCRHETGALVAVDERVVAHQAKGVGSRQVGHIRFAVIRQLPGARQRGVKQALITQTSSAAVLGQLLLVHRNQYLARQPAPGRVGGGHLASSRSTSRYSFMISRAASIASANSAS